LWKEGKEKETKEKWKERKKTQSNIKIFKKLNRD
jgi:hypothetical protein